METKYKAVALDLDGTLTTSDKKITKKTKDIIHKAIAKGIKIILASGRPDLGINPVAENLELDKLGGYVIAYNGAHIYECNTNKTIYQALLPENLIPDLCNFARENDIAALVYNKSGVCTELPDDKYVGIEAYNNHAPIFKVDNLASFIDYPVEKMMMVGNPEKVQQVLAKGNNLFGKYISMYCSEPYFLEVAPLNVEKAFAIEKLLNYLHLSKEELMVCGDGLNDIPMLKVAGLAVVMENGQDETKKCADYITSSNNEDGVAKAMEKFLKI